MNLASPKGIRERLSWAEVAALLQMKRSQVHNLVYGTAGLQKRYSGEYPFYYEDVNRFILDFNNGKINPGRGRKNGR